MNWIDENPWVLFATAVLLLVGYFFRGFLQEAGKDAFSFVKRQFAPASLPASADGDASEEGKTQGGATETRHQQLPIAVPEPTPHIPDLTLEAIKDAIEKAVPMQRPSVKVSYIGIRVKWTVYFRDAKDKGSTFHVRLSAKPGRLTDTVCDVDAETYPQFRILEEDAPLVVSGVIESWDYGDANLKDVSFFFPPKEKT